MFFWLESLFIFLPSQYKFWLVVLKTIKDFYINLYRSTKTIFIKFLIGFVCVMFTFLLLSFIAVTKSTLSHSLAFFLMVLYSLIMIFLRILGFISVQYWSIIVCSLIKSSIEPKSYQSFKNILIKGFRFAAMMSFINFIVLALFNNFILRSIFSMHSCIFLFFLDSRLLNEFMSVSIIKRTQLLLRVFYNALLMQFYNLPFFIIINTIWALFIYAIYFYLDSHFGLYILIHALFLMPLYISIVSNFYIKNRYEHFNLYKEA